MLPGMLESAGVNEYPEEALALVGMANSKIPELGECPGFGGERFLNLSALYSSLLDYFASIAPKLSKVGMDVETLIEAYVMAFAGDERLSTLIDQARNKIPVVLETTTENIESDAAREQLHTKIIGQHIDHVKTAEELDERQKVVMVVAPLAGGKTEAIEQYLGYKQNNDRVVVIDLDEIRKALMDGYHVNDQAHVAMVQRESWEVSDMIFKAAIESGRSVVIQTGLQREERWLNDKNIESLQKNNIPIDIIHILRPFTDCLIRNSTRERLVPLHDLYSSMNGINVMQKFVEKFVDIIRSVTVLDYYPQTKQLMGILPILFLDEYETYRDFINGRRGFVRVDNPTNLAVSVSQ